MPPTPITTSPQLIHFPVIKDARGNLIALEQQTPQVPFDIKRVYYMMNVPKGVDRGGHAHKALQGVLIAMRGSVDILVDTGSSREVYTLDSPEKGLHLPPGIWREMLNFSEDAVLTVLASEVYDEADYIREYPEFLAWVNTKK